MHASTIGKRSLPVVRPQSLEAIKWTALVLMLIEHAFFFVFTEMPAVVMLMGRSVFPLFAMALAVGVSGMDPANRAARGALLVRMLSWAIVAAAAGSLVREGWPANVLFTLALGLLLYHVVGLAHWTRYVHVSAVLMLGFAVEYGPFGVAAVALICAWGRAQGSPRGISKLLSGVALICFANGNAFAFFAPLIAWAIDRGDINIPRVPRFFYWAYAGQWPVFAVLRAAL